MPPFIADPPHWVYLVLAGLLVITGAVAASKQDRRAATTFGVAFLLMLVVFVLDKAFESPREEATRRAFVLGVAADARNPDAFAEQVADKVAIQTDGGQMKTVTRDELKKSQFWSLLKQWNVRVTTSGFSRDDVKQIDENTVEIGFVAKGDAEGKQIPVYARATFGKQADGSYKLTAFKAFEFMDRTKVFAVPGFPN